MKATFTLFSYCHSSKKKKKKFRARLPWLLQVTVMLAIENSDGEGKGPHSVMVLFCFLIGGFVLCWG